MTDNVIAVVAAFIVVTTLATLILGVLSYLAFRGRDRRRPTAIEAEAPARRFFVRYVLPDEEAGTG